MANGNFFGGDGKPSNPFGGTGNMSFTDLITQSNTTPVNQYPTSRGRSNQGGNTVNANTGGGFLSPYQEQLVQENLGGLPEGWEGMNEAEKKNALRDSVRGEVRGKAFGAMAPSFGLSAAQTGVGLANLLNMGDIPEYQEPERLQQAYNQYGQIAQQGLPGVLQGTEQRMQRNLQTGRQEAMDQAGPSTANAINAAMTSQNLEGQRQIGEMEADQRLRGLEQQTNIAQTLRNLQDQRTQAERERYAQEEAAYAGAAKSGMHNIVNSANTLTGMLMSMGAGPFSGISELQQEGVPGTSFGGGGGMMNLLGNLGVGNTGQNTKTENSQGGGGNGQNNFSFLNYLNR